MALSSLGVGVTKKRSGQSSPSDGGDELDAADVSGDGQGLTKPNCARAAGSAIWRCRGCARRTRGRQRTGRTMMANG